MTTATREARRTPRGRSLPASAGWLALGALLVLAFALLLYLGRTTTFYFDEWDWVQLRRDWDVDALLAPHNEHLSLAPVLVFKTLFATVGGDSYVPYRVVGLLFHCAVVGLLFAYARRRVGDFLALAAAAVVLFLGSAWHDVLWPFQIGFLGSLAAGIGALLALDREDQRGDLLAAVLLAVALASSSIGVPLLLAAAVEVLGRPDRRARWWIVAAPFALYLAWYLAYGTGGAITSDKVFGAPTYVAEAAAGAAGAVFSLGGEWGRALVVAGLAALLLALSRRGGVSWRLLALCAAPLAFWGLTAVVRGGLADPAASRYLYPGAIFLLLIASEAAAGVRLTRGALAVVAVFAAFSVVGNAGAMREGAGFLRDQSTSVKGALAALSLVSDQVTPDFQPAPEVAPQIRAGAYLDAQRDLGIRMPSAGALPGLYERARAQADETLRRALGPKLTPDGGRPGGAAPALAGATATRRGACQVLHGPGSAEVVLPAGGVQVRATSGTARVSLRRYSDVYGGQPVGTVATDAPVALQLPADASRVPWRAELAFSGAARVCGR